MKIHISLKLQQFSMTPFVINYGEACDKMIHFFLIIANNDYSTLKKNFNFNVFAQGTKKQGKNNL